MDVYNDELATNLFDKEGPILSLSPAAAASIRGIIDQNIAPPPSQAAAAAALPTDFCSLWPAAKPILQTLVVLVSAIPGLGKSGPILTSLIAVGDSVFQQTCAASAAVAADAHIEARAVVDAALGNVSAAATTAAAAGTLDFCSVWPQAKPVLQLLSGIVILIPGAGAAAGPILTGLIAVGDSIFKQTCPAN